MFPQGITHQGRTILLCPPCRLIGCLQEPFVDYDVNRFHINSIPQLYSTSGVATGQLSLLTSASSRASKTQGDYAKIIHYSCHPVFLVPCGQPVGAGAAADTAGGL